ncbi:MAG TPA: hypothetical protein VJN88_01680 [Ktedonobacterales bacterium]|nr:hypothetical protein [Ktedonobacterales bacterium]
MTTARSGRSPRSRARSGTPRRRSGTSAWARATPSSALLGACFRAGFVLDGLEEPSFTEPMSSTLALNWGQLPEMPPVLAGRLRVAER